MAAEKLRNTWAFSFTNEKKNDTIKESGRNGLYFWERGVKHVPLNIAVGDVLELKKKHPCGSLKWDTLRTGADFKIKCQGCGYELMLPRVKLEKSVRKINGKTFS